MRYLFAALAGLAIGLCFNVPSFPSSDLRFAAEVTENAELVAGVLEIHRAELAGLQAQINTLRQRVAKLEKPTP